ncbi:MAG TPA: NAD(P)H-quinone dehydrogenase [Actinomycetes bacterium]|jgi:pyruvate/2-oxoglutarate dehydrogenase complex dihydrolipoamide dehydrogenase (E3) component|nr:NAD(P)H-quinone dehydrogenase [Actinomycetes bacterium]
MRVVIIGGGPGGYEAALVAADLGAEVTIVNDEGLGGACVLWDCVPSKTLLTSAQAFNTLETAPSLGVHFEDMQGLEVPRYEVDLPTIMARVRDLALAQSEDIAKKVLAAGVRVVLGRGRVVDPHTVEVRPVDGGGASPERLQGDAILLATGSDPRRMDTAPTDGEVILSSQDVYKLRQVPEHLVVIGAGATGAEYATAFLRFGAQVTFVVSRDRILPTEDRDAAMVVEDVFERRGLRTVKNARAAKVERVGDRGVVHLEDGRTVEGSHVLLTIGQVPQTNGLGLNEVGVRTDERGAVVVDGVSRTSVPSIYAAGDVTAKLMLASVAAMQGRIAMWHLLGQAVSPLRWDAVAATIFTDPQIATVGLSEQRAAETGIEVEVDTLPLAGNSRAKMSNRPDGFVKLLARPGSGTIAGGAVVASYASDLIAPISAACSNRLTAGQLSQAFQVYPSFAGSIQECARRLAVRVQGSYRY